MVLSNLAIGNNGRRDNTNMKEMNWHDVNEMEL